MYSLSRLWAWDDDIVFLSASAAGVVGHYPDVEGDSTIFRSVRGDSTIFRSISGDSSIFRAINDESELT